MVVLKVNHEKASLFDLGIEVDGDLKIAGVNTLREAAAYLRKGMQFVRRQEPKDFDVQHDPMETFQADMVLKNAHGPIVSDRTEQRDKGKTCFGTRLVPNIFTVV